jgi:hypothetical protein
MPTLARLLNIEVQVFRDMAEVRRRARRGGRVQVGSGVRLEGVSEGIEKNG